MRVCGIFALGLIWLWPGQAQGKWGMVDTNGITRIPDRYDESSSSGTQERLFDDFIPELKNPRMMREGRVSLDELVSAIEDLLDNQKKSVS